VKLELQLKSISLRNNTVTRQALHSSKDNTLAVYKRPRSSTIKRQNFPSIFDNLPLHKVSNQQFKYLFQKCTNQHIPRESTLWRNYLYACNKGVLRIIRTVYRLTQMVQILSLTYYLMFRVVFWAILPCKMIADRRFRGAYCLHHQGWVLPPSLMKEAVRTSETSVDNHSTRQYNPEDNSEHHTLRRENLKSHTLNVICFVHYDFSQLNLVENRICSTCCRV
jgi:hypothetical protein